MPKVLWLPKVCSPAASLTTPSMFFRLRYSPFLAQIVVIRRCNLSCGYCSEYDKVSEPVPVEILEERLRKLKALGTFGISLTGGEPTMHPDLPRIIRTCRELRFYRTSMISNGFFLQPELIQTLNKAGLQRMQLSIDGVKANETTQKVLNNLKKRLQWLRDHARFEVVISAVIGACPPEEADELSPLFVSSALALACFLCTTARGNSIEQRRLEGIREHRRQAAKEMAGILGIPQRAGTWPSRAVQMSLRQPLSLRR